MSTPSFLRLLAGLLLSIALIPGARAADPDSDARQAWQMLDYIGVDYAGAVRDGAVIEPGEYAEMQEFAGAVVDKLAALPARPEQPTLLAGAQQLRAAIGSRAEPTEVAKQAHALADTLMSAYGIAATPATAPAVATAAPMYAQMCAGCHGALGHGDGVAAAGLTPPPIAFSDRERAAQRSPLALYQVISQGLPGTAMASYSQLPEADRWALAYYVGGLAFSTQEQAKGEALWRDDPALRGALPSLEALSRSSVAELARTIDAAAATAITAYLRAHPDFVAPAQAVAAGAGAFAVARQRLADSLSAYRNGDQRHAKELALSAYLDGFEPNEPALAGRDADLMHEIEAAMAQFRALTGKAGSMSELEAKAQSINALFDRADSVMQVDGSGATTAFVGSFTILLREGLEALLIVIGMIAFLRKAERREVLPYVHAGWIGALLAGGLTWGVATYLVSISGANREVTEGLSSLFAAVVLLGVGIWMHQKSLAGRWQQYLHEKLSAALTRRSAAFLFLLSFVAVYREVFETILFYAAMWNEQDGNAILAGLVAGSLVLAATAFALLRFSMRLPIGKFFAISSLLIALLAVVLVGKGIAALQEAGWVAQGLVSAPRVEWLGVYPSWQSLLAQVAVVMAAVFGFAMNARAGRALARVKES
jgi:high-affinity iron transporter